MTWKEDILASGIQKLETASASGSDTTEPITAKVIMPVFVAAQTTPSEFGECVLEATETGMYPSIPLQ